MAGPVLGLVGSTLGGMAGESLLGAAPIIGPLTGSMIGKTLGGAAGSALGTGLSGGRPGMGALTGAAGGMLASPVSDWLSQRLSALLGKGGTPPPTPSQRMAPSAGATMSSLPPPSGSASSRLAALDRLGLTDRLLGPTYYGVP